MAACRLRPPLQRPPIGLLSGVAVSAGVRPRQGLSAGRGRRGRDWGTARAVGGCLPAALPRARATGAARAVGVVVVTADCRRRKIYEVIQYCPVNLRGIGQEANGGGAFRVTKGVSDLNRKWRFAQAFRVSPSESPCTSARPCLRRSWTSCRGRPSIASSIDTAAITGRAASVAPSSFASWPLRN